MAPGDTCAVFAGTYNEVVTIPAGAAGLYKTLQVNNGDTVNVFGFVVNSHTKVIGFKITNPSSPSSAACIAVAGNATDWFVTNNVMYACGDGRAMIDEPVNFAFVTKNGVAQAPANPVSTATNPAVLTPNPKLDLFMHSGDTLTVD